MVGGRAHQPDARRSCELVRPAVPGIPSVARHFPLTDEMNQSTTSIRMQVSICQESFRRSIMLISGKADGSHAAKIASLLHQNLPPDTARW